MKLIYLWIENYGYIKEQGYLLNAGYDVKYDREKNTLSISEKGHIDCMLYGNRISVTAIVGDNGAGKSTLLDAIRTILFDKDRRKAGITGFLVWEDSGNLNLFPFTKDAKQNIETDVTINEWFPDDFNLIYYSDFLDAKYYLEEFDDGEGKPDYIEELGYSLQERFSVQLNISTSHLLRESSSVLDYFHSDTKKQMDFYGSLQSVRLLPFPAPTSLSVKIEFLDIDIFDRVLDASLQAYEYMGMGHHGEINTKAYVIGLLKEMEEAYQKKTILNIKPLEAIQILQWDIFTDYIYNLLAMRKQDHEELHDYDWVDDAIKKVVPIEIDESNIWDVLEKIFSKESAEETFEDYLYFYHKTEQMLKASKNGDFLVHFRIPDYMMQALSDQPPFSIINPIAHMKDIRDIDDILDRFPEEYMNLSGWNGNWNRDAFMDFYDSYMRISYELDFLKSSWGMSSGESSMFSLFARLQEAMRKWEKEKVILIFDELDSSFHPQWQQKIINSLTSFLRASYPQKEFQIILTTHSPVLLSDIPRENVIFMRKETIAEPEHAQTFAANIANLYYDSFFMEKGSIGEVARNGVIHLMEAISELEEEKQKGTLGEDRAEILFKRFLQKQYPEAEENILKNSMEKSSGKERNLLQMLIDNIGEDIWRYKANEQFHHFLEDDETNRKMEIRSQLNELKKSEGKESVREFLRQYLMEEER